eukprot:scaffold7040_cov256-Pinguiococcus_pyrenoidosus.AAC.14
MRSKRAEAPVAACFQRGSPMIWAPAPKTTPSATFGCRSPTSFPFPPASPFSKAKGGAMRRAGRFLQDLRQQRVPKVTKCAIETPSPTTAVSPITIPLAKPTKNELPMRAAG